MTAEARTATLRGVGTFSASTVADGPSRLLTTPQRVTAGQARPVRSPRVAPGADGPLSVPLPPGLPLEVRAASWNRAMAWGLTPRELQVLELSSLGFDTKGIAREMWISDLTVKSHFRRTLERFDAATRAELVAKAFSARALVPRRLEPGVAAIVVPAGQRAVLPGIAAGLTDRGSGSRLNLSEEAVKSRVKGLLRVLGASSREHAIRLAVENGIVARRQQSASAKETADAAA